MGNHKIMPINEEIIGKLNTFLVQSKIEDFSCNTFNPFFSCAVLYPTDDFHLAEEQFSAIKKLLKPNEKMFVIQANLHSELLSRDNICNEISYPYSYESYCAIWLDTISLLFSDSFQWVVLTNEALDGGEGVFVGYPESVNLFLSEYGHGEKDIQQFRKHFSARGLCSKEAQTHMNEMILLDKKRTGERTEDGLSENNNGKSP